MRSIFVMAIALVILSLAGLDILRTREHNRAVEIVLLEAQCEERISRAREMRIIVDLKLKAIEAEGMKGYLKTCEILERKK